jgi:hypothetical protein
LDYDAFGYLGTHPVASLSCKGRIATLAVILGYVCAQVVRELDAEPWGKVDVEDVCDIRGKEVFRRSVLLLLSFPDSK